MKQQALKPVDIVVCCQLALTPNATFQVLSRSTGISVGECHNAVRRLTAASLLNPIARRPATELLLRFLVHGVPYAFAPTLGEVAVGVPTGLGAPVLAEYLSASESHVWAHVDGEAQGIGLTPLFPHAAELPGRNNRLYEILALVDVLRTGQAREKKLAEELLRERLTRPQA
jgi:hypothetical protein